MLKDKTLWGDGQVVFRRQCASRSNRSGRVGTGKNFAAMALTHSLKHIFLCSISGIRGHRGNHSLFMRLCWTMLRLIPMGKVFAAVFIHGFADTGQAIDPPRRRRLSNSSIKQFQFHDGGHFPMS